VERWWDADDAVHPEASNTRMPELFLASPRHRDLGLLVKKGGEDGSSTLDKSGSVWCLYSFWKPALSANTTYITTHTHTKSILAVTEIQASVIVEISCVVSKTFKTLARPLQSTSLEEKKKRGVVPGVVLFCTNQVFII